MNVALPTERLNIISLCTGGGGLDLGIGLALPSAHPIVLLEREAFAVAHLVAAIEQGLLAEAAIWSDVRTFDGRPFRGLVDGLIGGIPCQGHSMAGKKRGSLDERDLWSPARRIIVQSRPWFVVIENVEGMLSPGDDEIAGAERVVRDLSKLRYTVEIGLFSATEAGASHQRNRIFIVAVADDDRGLGNEGTGPGAARYRLPEFGLADVSDDLADAASPRCEERQNGGTGRGDASGDRRRRQEFERDGRELADTCGARLAIRQQSDVERRTLRHEGKATGADCGAMDIAIGRRRTTGRLNHGSDDRNVAGPTSQQHLADADLVELRPIAPARQQLQLQQDDGDGRDGFPSLYPPGPSDLNSWRRVLAHSPDLEPAVRRMADGVAARLDLSGPHAARIERLRLLGNGVVCLEAAYAFRTLCTRLAASGSARAAQLVRLMGEIS